MIDEEQTSSGFVKSACSVHTRVKCVVAKCCTEKTHKFKILSEAKESVGLTI